MILARVRGEVYGTIMHPFYEGRRMLLVDKMDFQGTSTGEQMIAIDSVDAGAGDLVIILDEGNGARQIVQDKNAPLRSIIVGVVDRVDL